MGQRRFVAGGIFAYKIVKQCMERAEVVQSVKLPGPARSFCPFSTRFSLLEEAITLAAFGQTELQAIANSLAHRSLLGRLLCFKKMLETCSVTYYRNQSRLFARLYRCASSSSRQSQDGKMDAGKSRVFRVLR